MKLKKVLALVLCICMVLGTMSFTASAEDAIDVAKIGDVTYKSLAEALKAAKDGDTITLISGPDQIVSAAGTVCGKTVTITGTAKFDWSKGWLYVGRNGEGDGKLIFDNAVIKTGVTSSSYGIHVSGAKKGDSTTNYGEVEFINSDIELSYFINRNKATVDGGKLFVQNGFAVTGRPASETPDGNAGIAQMNIINDAEVTVDNMNGMGIGHESNGVFNVEDSSFTSLRGFAIYESSEFNVSGDVSVNIPEVTKGGTVDAKGDVTFTDSVIGGTVVAGDGNMTFDGVNKVAYLNTNWSEVNTYTINEGASLAMTSSNRMTLGYGDTFVVNGSIDDAKAADKSAITPSLSIPAGISITGYDGANFTANNAYINLGLTQSKNSVATGSYIFDIDNSVFDFSNNLSFTASTSNKTPEFDVNIKNSVMNFNSNLDLANVKCDVTIDNSNVNVKSSMRNVGKLNVINGSNVIVKSQIHGTEHGGNEGTISVDNSKLSITCSNMECALYGNDGYIILKNAATADVTYINTTNIKLDGTSRLISSDIANTCAIEVDLSSASAGNTVIECTNLNAPITYLSKESAKIDDTVPGVITVVEAYEASVTTNGVTEYYQTIEEAFTAAAANDIDAQNYVVDTIKLLSNVETTEKLYISGHDIFDLNGKTLKTSKGIQTKNWALATITSTASARGTIDYTGTGAVISVRNALDEVSNIKIDGNGTAASGIEVYAEGRYVNKVANCEIIGVKNGLYTYMVNTTDKYPAFGLVEDVTIEAGDIGIFFMRGGIVKDLKNSNIKGARLGIAYWGHSALGYLNSVNAENCTIEGTTGAAVEMTAEWYDKASNSYSLNLKGCELIGEKAVVVDRDFIKEPDKAVTFTDCGLEFYADDEGMRVFYTEKPSSYEGTLYGKVAEVNGTEYLTLQEAIDAVDGNGVVTLLRDTYESAIVKAPVNTTTVLRAAPIVTLDLAGYTLNGYIFVNAGAKVEIKDGKIVNENENKNAIETLGVLTLTDVDATSVRSVVRVDGEGEATINSGSYKVNNKYNMTVSAVNASAKAKVTIADGVFVADGGLNEASHAVKSRDDAIVTINGGKFSNGVQGTLNGTSAANIVVNGGFFDEDPTSYVGAESDVVYTGNTEYPYAVAAKSASEIKVELVMVEEGLYNIVLKSADNYDINEFVSAELTFADSSITVGGGDMQYEILGIEGKTVAQKAAAEDKKDQFIISIPNADDRTHRLTGKELVIGQVKFYGQGTVNFSVVDGLVVTTQLGTNLGRYYGTNDYLNIADAVIVDGTITKITRDVVVNVAYNHPLVTDKWTDGNQITVTLKDGFGDIVGTDDISDGIATFDKVRVGRITVTLEAPGFRKYVYETTLEEGDSALVLNFWNNVKRNETVGGVVIDPKEEIETGKGYMAHNFLVGDIVMDYTVDEYDLAAVTSYYGTYGIENTAKYLKYDLNRDGNIDIIDVHYVLHTLNN